MKNITFARAIYLLFFSGCMQTPQSSQKIEQLMAKHLVPGVAIAIIENRQREKTCLKSMT